MVPRQSPAAVRNAGNYPGIRVVCLQLCAAPSVWERTQKSGAAVPTFAVQAPAESTPSFLAEKQVLDIH